MSRNILLYLTLMIAGVYCNQDVLYLLDVPDFQEEAAKSNLLVLFYSPHCEWSQKFLPNYKEFAKKINSNEGSKVKVAQVDCFASKDVCQSQKIDGYPTLKGYKMGESEAIEYKYSRNEPHLAKFIIEAFGEDSLDEEYEIPKKMEALIELTDETFTAHVAAGQHFVKFYAPWCGHCQRLAPTWDELAEVLQYDFSVSISKIDCAQFRPVCQDFEVKGYPTLLWIEDGKKIEKYSGPRSLEELKLFVEKMSQEVEGVTKDETLSFGVFQLTGQNFEHSIEKGVSFINFFAPWCGHCKRLAPTWEQLSAKFQGNSAVTIAKVDCTMADNKELCSEQEVGGYPMMYIYKNGEKLSEYKGSRSLDEMYEFVNSHIGHDEL